MDELTRLSESKYLSLTTFRKDGRKVATPVWVTRDGAHLYVITDADSGKVKRLRNNPEVLLAPCDMRGKVTGAETSGTAELLDAAGTAKVRSLVDGRYGLMSKAMGLLGRLRRGSSGSVGIRITPASAG